MTSLMKIFLLRKAFALIALGLFTISLTSYGETYTDEADFSFNNGTITNYNGSGGVVNITPTIDGVAVTSIGEEAFSDCDSLTSVTIDATTPPSISTGNYDHSFRNNASGRKFYVPAGSVTTYKTNSDWSEYADDILSQ